MNCQDNSRLKVPLPELCKTTDIGCVPATSGKPDCPPEADQLPLAYDKDSQTLWLFDCETREWIGQTKFQLAELQEVSLDNIRNICSLLKIPVYYNPGGGTVQGSMPLADFGKELLKCQDMTPKVAILPTGNVSFSIEGLDSLDPMYVKFENLTASGQGTSSSPFVLKAQDPMDKWPVKTEADVDASTRTMIAATVDGQFAQVPYPSKPCAYPKLTKAQVEAASDVLVIGCVDDRNVKIPYPETGATADTMTQDQVDSALGKYLLAVINGKIYRIPFPKEPCEYTAKSAATIKNQTTSILACAGGESSKIELSDLSSLILGSGEVSFDSIAWPTIPTQCDPPTLAPTNGFPFQLDCDGNLWIWNAAIRRWLRLTNADAPPGSDVPYYSSIASRINNPCSDVLLRAWYLDKNDPGSDYKNAKINPTQLAGVLDNCGLVSETEMANYFRGGFQGLTYSLCHNGYDGDSGTEWETIHTNCGSVALLLKNIKFDDGYATYAMHSQRWLRGSGENNLPLRSQYGTDPRNGQPVYVNYKLSDVKNGLIQIKNPFDRTATAQVVCAGLLYAGGVVWPSQYTQSLLVGVTTDPYLSDDHFLCSWRKRIINGIQIGEGCGRSAPTGNMAAISSVQLWNQSMAATQDRVYGSSGLVYSPTPNYFRIAANNTLDLFMRVYVTWMAVKSRYYGDRVETPLTGISGPGFGAIGYLVVTWFPS